MNMTMELQHRKLFCSMGVARTHLQVLATRPRPPRRTRCGYLPRAPLRMHYYVVSGVEVGVRQLSSSVRQ